MNKLLTKYLEITNYRNKKELLKKEIEKIIQKENIKTELIDYKNSIVLQKECYESGLNFCVSVLFDFSARYIEIDFAVFEDSIDFTKEEFEKYNYTLENIHNHFEVKHLHFKKYFQDEININKEELKFLLYCFL